MPTTDEIIATLRAMQNEVTDDAAILIERLREERDALAATLQVFREKIETNFAVTVGFDNEPSAILAARDNRVRVQTIPPLLFEAHDYGQFADDFDQPLAKPIRKAIRDMLKEAKPE